MDTISNMIIQIKNAGNAGHSHALVPYSKLKHSIAEILKRDGFVKEVEVVTEKFSKTNKTGQSGEGKKMLSIELVFEKTRLSTGRQMPKINGVKRISKPSKRVYKKSSEVRAVKNGYGALILSTSKGVMTGREAKKASLGGEALFQIW